MLAGTVSNHQQKLVPDWSYGLNPPTKVGAGAGSETASEYRLRLPQPPNDAFASIGLAHICEIIRSV